MAFSKPAQWAVRERLQRRRTQRDGVLTAAPQRFIGAQLLHTMPLTWIGARHTGGCQATELLCGTGPSAVFDRTVRGADHSPQAAHHRGCRKHLRGLHRGGRDGRGIAGRQPGQLGDEDRRQGGLIRGVAVHRGDQQPPPGPAHRGDQQAAFLGQQRGAYRHVLAETVENVEQALSAQHPAARSGVRPQPVLHTGDHDHLPVALECGVRTEHRHRLPRGGGIGGHRWQLQGRDVLQQTRQRGPGGAGHVGLGDVEQCGDRAEVALGQGSVGGPAVGGGHPAALQAAAFPRLPQGVARIVVAAVAAGRRGEYRPHPLDRGGEGHRQLRGRTGERLAQRAVGAPQRAAQLAQRHRIHPPEGAAQQRLGSRVVEAVLGGGQHGQQRAGTGLLADGPARRRLIDRDAGDRKRPGQRLG